MNDKNMEIVLFGTGHFEMHSFFFEILQKPDTQQSQRAKKTAFMVAVLAMRVSQQRYTVNTTRSAVS